MPWSTATRRRFTPRAPVHDSAAGDFRPDIEGLRALAILLVVAYHAGVPGLSGGYVGVDVFFVVSGYLITGLLMAEIRATGRVDFAEFYARRIRRLLPAAITVVLATLLLGRLVYAPVEHQELATAGIATSLYVSNVQSALSATDYLAEPERNPLLHAWSLAVEEQFYLFWPAIVLFGLVGRRRGVRPRRLAGTMVAIAAASYALCVWQTGVAQPAAFFLLPARAWEFALGALARMAPDLRAPDGGYRPAMAWAGLLAVLGAGIGFGPETDFPGAIALLPVAGTALMLAAGAGNASAGPLRLLTSEPMQWIGRLSYSWYLWHWPILTFAREFPGFSGARAGVALSALSLGLAALTHALIENPVRFHPVLRGRPRWSLLMAAALTLGGAGASYLVGAVGTWQARSPDQTIYREARQLPPVYRDGCHAPLLAREAGPCAYGDSDAAATIVLFGDSHAAQWYSTFDAIARERGMRLVSLTKSACPAAEVRLDDNRLRRRYIECELWRDAVVRRILRLRPTLVVISHHSGYVALPGERSRWTVSAEAWQAGLERTIARFDSAGIRTVLLADTPSPGFNVPSCLERAAWNPALHGRECHFPRTSPRIELAHQIDRAVAAKSPSAEVVNLNDAICRTDPCWPMSAGVVLFRDALHLTNRFAASLAGLLELRILGEAAPGEIATGSPRSGDAGRGKPGTSQ